MAKEIRTETRIASMGREEYIASLKKAEFTPEQIRTLEAIDNNYEIWAGKHPLLSTDSQSAYKAGYLQGVRETVLRL
jgi:hypothetical protein